MNMQDSVSCKQCTNPLAYVFVTEQNLSHTTLTSFFTHYNIEHSQKDFVKIGLLAERVVREVLTFYEIRTVFIANNTLTVVLKNNKQWETLPDQIVRIIEKAQDEFGEML